MSDPRDVARLEREDWFIELRHWYQESIVEGMDGATYKGRDVLPRDINVAWVRSRLSAAHIENSSPGWVLSILEGGFKREGDPMPLQVPTIKALEENDRHPV